MTRFFLICIGIFFLLAAPAMAQTTVSVIGPVTPGDCATFNSTTIIKDAGVTCNTGGTGSPGGANGSIQFNNSGVFGGLTSIANSFLAQMPADTVKCNPTGSTAIPQDCTNPVVSGLTVNPTGGLNTAITSNQTLSGTTAVPFTPNGLTITDSVNAGANFVLGWDFTQTYGGSTVQGGRQTLTGFGILTAPTSPSNPLRSYVGVTGAVTAQSADNGTNPTSFATAKGAIFGGNFSAQANNGATALNNVTASEFNVAMQTGSTAFAKSIIQLSSNVTDAVSGSAVDAMIWGYNQPGATNHWGNGIRFDDLAGSGVWPFNSSSTIIQTGGSGTANTGIDFSNTTFTVAAFKSPGFVVDGAGNIAQAGGAWAAFTAAPACGTATITTNSARSKSIGKTTFIEGDFTITAIGSCNGTTVPFSFTLPNTAADAGVLSAQETTGSLGAKCRVIGTSATSTCSTTPPATGFVVNNNLVFSGVYENQ